MNLETVKGFRDFTASEAEKREKIRATLVKIFTQYGFEPAETPIIEYEDFVRGENINDEAVSDIYKLIDKGGRKLALRYELTFQLKRLMIGKKLPYKRYSIGPVFRDEPTTRNRFRQFVQGDIDIVASTLKEEAEILAVVKRVLTELGIKFVININNRKLLNEILTKKNIKETDFERIIKEIDKLDKLPRDEIYNNLRAYAAQDLLALFDQPEVFFEKYENYKEIKELKDFCRYYGIVVNFVPSLARGLSYYNGAVFEVKSALMKETITGGGSYIFNGIQCTGISFGLDRLSNLAEMGELNNTIMIISINEDEISLKIAELFRNRGKNCIYSSDKLSKALDYANSRKIKKVFIMGEEEGGQDKIKLKNMETGHEELIELSKILGGEYES